MPIYWGDTHHNTYQYGPQDPPMDEVLSDAGRHLDFYTTAYYTAAMSVVPDTGGAGAAGAAGTRKGAGIHVERTKAAALLEAEWQQVQRATAAHNQPGRFVTLPGYEWQGDGRWGDHNVICKDEGQPIVVPDTLAELYAALSGRHALAIPHHTGYLPGLRAPRWECCDTRISPFAELFSIHGCSETDEEWIGLRRNGLMAPGTSGATYQDALDRGLVIGAIASTDNWSNVPGCWGQGLMACVAGELSRDGLWEAFTNRRVYGVTGDRIELDFSCNGLPMGSVMQAAGKREIRVAAVGADAIDRIELLRNGRVIATHCHQGSWGMPRPGRVKLRIEAGWGPRANTLPVVPRLWSGAASLSEGRFVAWQPCWISRGQRPPRLKGGWADFVLPAPQQEHDTRHHNAIVLEIEAPSDAVIDLKLDDLSLRQPLAELAAGSRVMWDRAGAADLLARRTHLDPKCLVREDPLYHLAWKVKIHRPIPQAGYTADMEFVDDEPLTFRANYRVRVEQRNGQRAWSSPIWVDPVK